METSISDYIISKLATRLTLAGGKKFGDDIDFLFYDIHNNPHNFKTGIEQGTITIRRISTIPVMFNIDYPEALYRRNEYCILRFIQKDSKGNAILSYKNIMVQKYMLIENYQQKALTVKLLTYRKLLVCILE